MENILGIDLNEIVSQQVSEKLSEMEQTIEEQSNQLINLRREKNTLENRLHEAQTAETLLEQLKESFNALKAIKADKEKDIWEKSLSEVKYEFIQNILLHLFGVPKSGRFYRDSAWTSKLAIHYYDQKSLVVLLLKCFGVDTRYVTFVQNYVLPKHWSKIDVLEFVRNPKYNTNGQIFSEGEYWSGGKENLPYNYILVNPLIQEEEVFAELINTIVTKRGEWSNLYAVYRYVELTPEHLSALGNTLLTLEPKHYSFDVVTEFIRKNLNSFTKEVQDHLFKYASDDNQFNLFHWENFPVSYQKQYLLSKPVPDILKILTNYSCKWTTDDKEAFFKEKYKN